MHHLTVREYLFMEEHSNVRHEYFDGVAIAMSGGTRMHAVICVNVGASLHTQLRGRRCAVHSNDMKVCILATGMFAYPDVSVVCGHADLHPDTDHVITNPILIVEVLSPSTAAWDRGKKLGHYKQIPSLREVVLVAHDHRRVEIWGRGEGDTWTRSEISSGVATLESIQCTLALDDVYLDPLAMD